MALGDPRALCAALDLGVRPADRQLQTAGVTVRCPRHGGVSCSVTRGKDGTVRVRCFGCDFSGDALHLIAEVRGLSIRRNFVAVLREAATLAHRWDLAHELDAVDRRTAAVRGAAVRATVGEPPDPSYPPEHEVVGLWSVCGPCADDRDVAAALERRAICPDVVDEFGLARALPQHAAVPAWARFRGTRTRSAPWTETGHRLVVPVYDEHGRMRSVRAWCVRDGDDPKRLPPAGHSATGLVLACPNAAALLAHGTPEGTPPPLVIITEGEPDFLTWATRTSDAVEDPPVVLGVMSGSWSDRFAARIPAGSRVVLRTHHDEAGDRYARTIFDSLEGRCAVFRSRGCHGSV
jgi:hypothetical protein